ncbi:MAG: ADP-forming succinate--CoA ligase subunit beta [Candidatus Aminicenantes bacterium]|nr:ADP-forming succinate--CoA ligase subunit beta [Candidatus Aminicenantes bacterium]
MKLLEHQAKGVLSRYGISVPKGMVVETAAQAAAAAESLGPRVVLKAQVSAGGRGKAGGIKAAQGREDARAKAEAMLKSRLVTPQTGPAGLAVRRLLVEEAVEARSEFYIGVAIDRRRSAITVIVSSRGGVEIEETARTDPASILREDIDPQNGIQPFQARRLGFALDLAGAGLTEAAAIMTGMVRALLECDATLVEINPLVLTDVGRLQALDAKIVLDDNALFRHPEFQTAAEDPDSDPVETAAARAGLNYVRLGGDIGCLVNGAGLAMATADLIQAAGGQPADFLDIGGGVSEDSVKTAFEIVLADPAMRVVLVNIFGGIVRCDLVARGLIRAAAEKGVRVPFIVRFHGTNAEEGRALLADSGLRYESAETMGEAADKAVAAAAGIAASAPTGGGKA